MDVNTTPSKMPLAQFRKEVFEIWSKLEQYREDFPVELADTCHDLTLACTTFLSKAQLQSEQPAPLSSCMFTIFDPILTDLAKRAKLALSQQIKPKAVSKTSYQQTETEPDIYHTTVGFYHELAEEPESMDSSCEFSDSDSSFETTVQSEFIV